MACLLCKVEKQTNPKLVALSTLILAKRNSTEDIIWAMCEPHQKLARDTFEAARSDTEFAVPIGSQR